MAEAFSLTSDDQVEERVRTLTGYEDNADELLTDNFSNVNSENEGILGAAKAKIYTDVGTKKWYSDHHIGEALAYTAAIIAKERLENYTVEQWSIGNGAESVTVRGASQDEGQIRSWIESVESSINNSDVTDNVGTFSLTTRPSSW